MNSLRLRGGSIDAEPEIMNGYRLTPTLTCDASCGDIPLYYAEKMCELYRPNLMPRESVSF